MLYCQYSTVKSDCLWGYFESPLRDSRICSREMRRIPELDSNSKPYTNKNLNLIYMLGRFSQLLVCCSSIFLSAALGFVFCLMLSTSSFPFSLLSPLIISAAAVATPQHFNALHLPCSVNVMTSNRSAALSPLSSRLLLLLLLLQTFAVLWYCNLSSWFCKSCAGDETRIYSRYISTQWSCHPFSSQNSPVMKLSGVHNWHQG